MMLNCGNKNNLSPLANLISDQNPFQLAPARVANILIENIMAGNGPEQITADLMSLLPLSEQSTAMQKDVQKFVEKAILDLAEGDKPKITSNGFMLDERIIKKQFTNLENGSLKKVNAIVLHRTDSLSAADTLGYYQKSRDGAHFLIDTDGTIYQTASLNKKTQHVGYIRSRCHQNSTCEMSEINKIKKMESQIGTVSGIPKKIHDLEMEKKYPDRYPSNSDSVGIEVVGKYDPENGGYVRSTPQQRESLKYLVEKLNHFYKLQDDDVYPHTSISRKDENYSEGKYLGY